MSEATPFLTQHEHLDVMLERVLLLLTRHCLRYWQRLTDAQAHINNLFVSIEEVRHSLRHHHGEVRPSPSLQIPDLETIDAALAAHERYVLERLSITARESGLALPIENLRGIFGLSTLELDLLLVLAGIQLDPGLHRIARFAWADFNVHQPTLGFLAEVVTTERAEQHALRRCVDPAHPLRRFGILVCEGDDRWATTPENFLRLHLPDRITSYLLDTGYGATDAFEVSTLCSLDDEPTSPEHLGLDPSFRKALRSATRQAAEWARRRAEPELTRPPLLVLTGPTHDEHADAARVGIAPVMVIDLPRAFAGHAVDQRGAMRLLTLGFREAMLCQATPVVLFGHLLADETPRTYLLYALNRILQGHGELVVLSVVQLSGGVRTLLGPCTQLHVPLPTPTARLALWEDAFEAIGSGLDVQLHAGTLDDIAYRYTLSPRAIRASASEAILAAQSRRKRGRPLTVTPNDIHLAVRQRVEHQLGALAEPFSTPLTWNDIVLPVELQERLKEMVSYAQNARRVHDDWGFGRLSGYGRGLTALFSGPPGTGKTMMAAIIARELGSELYRVDLSRIVDKYIGETEKNLARIFDEAERSKAILLFDEADSLFGKRTNVKSSNDRYANLEVNFLLQRMEHFDGTSILTTNLSNEIDEAFQRRIKFRLEFPMPDVDDRAFLWRKMLPDDAPVDWEGMDFHALAEACELAPAHIKNAVIRAAFIAAQNDLRMDFDMLLDAARIEARELGILVRA